MQDEEQLDHSPALTTIVMLGLEIGKERNVLKKGRDKNVREAKWDLEGKLDQEKRAYGLMLTRISDLELELSNEQEVARKWLEDLTEGREVYEQRRGRIE